MKEQTTDLDQRPVAQGMDVSDSVPIIDIASLVSTLPGQSRDNAANQIGRACREWGFFQVINHGVDGDLINKVWTSARDFFRQPIPTKEIILRTRENPWGYYHNELTKNQRDKKEVFDFTRTGVDTIYHSENRWPAEPESFRETMETYLEAVTDLSLLLLEAFCIGLDLPAKSMHPDFEKNHTGFIRLNYYPVADPMAWASIAHLPEADMGVHHHTDAGALTILLQDDIGGLQVYREGFWHDVPPVEGAFVVNTGDMMQVWSNDLYQAAIHRVLAMEQDDRYSIPFFFNPAPDAVIEPLSTVTGEDRPPLYRPITWSEFRSKRTDGDYADYGTEVQISQFRIQT